MSEVRIKRPQADIIPTAAQGALLPRFNHGDSDVQQLKYCLFTPSFSATPPQFRITEDGNPRITENGFLRILETA